MLFKTLIVLILLSHRLCYWLSYNDSVGQTKDGKAVEQLMDKDVNQNIWADVRNCRIRQLLRVQRINNIFGMVLLVEDDLLRLHPQRLPPF